MPNTGGRGASTVPGGEGETPSVTPDRRPRHLGCAHAPPAAGLLGLSRRRPRRPVLGLVAPHHERAHALHHLHHPQRQPRAKAQPWVSQEADGPQ